MTKNQIELMRKDLSNIETLTNVKSTLSDCISWVHTVKNVDILEEALPCIKKMFDIMGKEEQGLFLTQIYNKGRDMLEASKSKLKDHRIE